jgi:hypothetical protein
MISASGSVTGSRDRIGRSSIRQKDATGAPVRSDPKFGNALVERADRRQFGGGDAPPAAAGRGSGSRTCCRHRRRRLARPDPADTRPPAGELLIHGGAGTCVVVRLSTDAGSRLAQDALYTEAWRVIHEH